MNGPPGNGEAARTLDRSEAAEDRNAAESLDDAEDERKFAELQERAARLGYTLRAVHSGFVLQRGNYSVHTADLITVSHALNARRPARGA